MFYRAVRGGTLRGNTVIN